MKSSLPMLLVMLFAWMSQGVWAGIQPTMSFSSLGDYAQVYPKWGNFAAPSVSLYIEEGGQQTPVKDYYQITYYIDGHESDTSFDVDENNGRQITTDAPTGTTVERYYGNVVVGGTPGTVTVRVVAKPKDAFAATYDEVSKTYSFEIIAVTPDVSVSPSALSLKVKHTEQYYGDEVDGTDNAWKKNKWDFTNRALRVALPVPSVTITKDGHTQNLSRIYDITYTAKSGSEDYLTVVTDGSGNVNEGGFQNYVVATLTSEALNGNGAETLQSPYSTPVDAILQVNFTPKTGYATVYKAASVEVPVTISQLDSKLSLTLAMRNPLTGALMAAGDTLHYSRYNERTAGKGVHPFPIPVVTASDGTDLSTHADLHVVYYAVKDSTYYDSCMKPETSSWGEVWEAGQPTGTNISTDIQEYQLNVTPSQLTTYKPGLLKVGMFIYGISYNGNVYDFKDWFEYTNRTPLENTKEGYGNRSTAWDCLTDTTFFYVDVMKRSPKLTFNPDPTKVNISNVEEINFTNRFEVSGYTDDSNDGTAGTLTYGPQWGAGDDTFWYSFEFSKDAGIEVIDWPHYDKMVALDADGKVVTPNNYDWNNGGRPIYTKEDSLRIQTYKYWSVKGYGTDNLWSIHFTKAGNIPVTYTIWPFNHARWDIGQEQVMTFVVEEGLTPKLNIDPQELVASISQEGFAEPEVWVTDNFDTEVSEDFNFTFTIAADESNTRTTVENSVGNTFQHEVNIGNKVGDVKVHVVATAKTDKASKYKVTTLEGDYLIHIVGGDPLYEIISSYDVTGYGTSRADSVLAAQDAVMGKMHFIRTGKLYAGYTISGVPGVEVRFGKYDGSSWEIKADPTSDVGSKCNSNDGDGTGNKFISDDTPVELNENGIAKSGSFYEFYAHTNGFLTVDARWQANHTYVLIDYDYPKVKEEYTPASEEKGEHTFTMPLLEDHSYHLYCKTGGQINMHGLVFNPAFINGSTDTAPVTKGSAFMNNFVNVPVLAENVITEVSYSSDNKDYVEVDGKTGEVDPKQFTFNLDPDYIPVRANVVSTSSTLRNKVFKYPYYNLVIADIPTYRLGDGKDKSDKKKDGLITDGTAQYYTPNAGDTVSTYNILTPITMTYGGWKNPYGSGNTKDSYSAKSNAEIAGFTKSDKQFNKYLDGFTWSNVGTTNPVDENNKKYHDYRWKEEDMSNANYKNSFSLPARGAYWRFEPRVGGTLFVYLIQNGVCSYSGDPQSLMNTSKRYYQLDWKPLYIVDETATPVSTNVTVDSQTQKLLISSGEEADGSYTEGLIRCNAMDMDVYRAQESKPDTTTLKCTFDWTKFEKAYIGDDADETALKEIVLEHWDQAGKSETIFQDPKSTGYGTISKAYVRYALNVKAGKSYWVFQDDSKPNFCGFGFVPNNFPSPSATPIEVTISDEDDMTLEKSLQDAGGAANVYDKDCNVTYSGRTFKNKTWTSLCLPFAVSEYNFKKVFGNDAKIVTYESLSDDKTQAHFTQHNYHMMEAGRPYFIRPDFNDGAEQKTTIVFEGVTFEEEKPAGSDKDTEGEKRLVISKGGFDFVGTYNGTTMPMYSYFLEESLRRVGATHTEGMPLGRYRAYMKNPTSNEGNAKLAVSSFETPYEDVPTQAEPTVIKGIHDGTIIDSGAAKMLRGIYTLEGKKVSGNADNINELPTGVYIVNGQKVIK